MLIVCLDPYPIYEIAYAIKALEFLHGMRAKVLKFQVLHGIRSKDIKALHDIRSLRVH